MITAQLTKFRLGIAVRALNTGALIGWLAWIGPQTPQSGPLSLPIALLSGFVILNVLTALWKPSVADWIDGALVGADLMLIAWAAHWTGEPAIIGLHIFLVIPLALSVLRLSRIPAAAITLVAAGFVYWSSGRPAPPDLPLRILALVILPWSLALLSLSALRRRSVKVRARTALFRSLLFHEFLSHLLFQMREYLTSITTVGQHLAATEEDPKSKEMAERLARMIDELNKKVGRMFEKIESHATTRGRGGPRVFSLATMLQECLKLTSEAYEVRGLKIRFWVDPKIPKIKGDYEILSAILSAALDNAFEAFADSGLGSTLSVSARLEKEKEMAHIQIADDAGGIPPGDVKNVFTPLFTTRSKTGGFGLGLSMSRRMLERTGGTIRVFSDDGRTIVNINVPLKPQLPHIRNAESTWASRRERL